MNKSVLIVDDESSIRETLNEILIDEGFKTLLAEDGNRALEMVANDNPNLVLLDIWMPGKDGMEVLREIKAIQPNLPVIMISGHAAIATAVEATRLGAIDFLEKPLDLNATLNAVKKAFNTKATQIKSIAGNQELLELENSTKAKIIPVFLKNQPVRGKLILQKTLDNSFVLHGHGVHTGKKTGLRLEPLPANSGIHFVSMGGTTAVPAYLDFVHSTGLATTLKNKYTQVSTIEHLMSALHAYGLTNILVTCNDEVPIMDGSALRFCEMIEEAGVVTQKGEDLYSISPSDTIKLETDNESIIIEPSDSLQINYVLDYPKPIGRQEFSFNLGSAESYKQEIAPARTFGFVKDIGYLQSKGLAQGGRFDNFILIGEEGTINSNLRFPNELARHKILDLIGDFYLTGRPVTAKITAYKTGHEDNVRALREILGK